MMSWFKLPSTKSASGSQKIFARMLFALCALLPTFAFAGAESNVKLSFSATDKYVLYASLFIGAIAIFFGMFLRKQIMSQTPGDEKMQEVGAAIKEGAMAYLRKQIGTMAIFIVLLGIVLFGVHVGSYGPMLALALTGCFVAGVAASYVAGYIGMQTAVDGNMRTAAAALTSYRSSLETAFRSGAVAGMWTVGMGLIGATLIFLLAGENAMKLLIGFGFGGSLAALFMRVGGGIFTKAADVGADLVGKVEAGIPEDDPRNPAVIADNVGDNVGDCAGMAADVFESYEVTLVAAIVLGAATSQIFDQNTWMKLILFALVARGIGIIASIVGILMVKGSDDLESDPLKPISSGFKKSAVVAGLLTCLGAYFMLGPNAKLGPEGKGISVGTLTTTAEAKADEFQRVHMVQDMAFKLKSKLVADKTWKTNRTGEFTMDSVGVNEIGAMIALAEKKGGESAVTAADFADYFANLAKSDPATTSNWDAIASSKIWSDIEEAREKATESVRKEAEAAGKAKKLTGGALEAFVKEEVEERVPSKSVLGGYEYQEQANQLALGNILQTKMEDFQAPKPLKGYAPIDFSDPNSKTYKFTVQEIQAPPKAGTTPPTPKFLSLGDVMKKYNENGKLVVLHLVIGQMDPSKPAERGQAPKKEYRDFYWGPVDRDVAKQVIAEATKANAAMEVAEVDAYKVVLMQNADGNIVAGVTTNADGKQFTAVDKLQPAGAGLGLAGFYKESKDVVSAAMNNRNPQNPTPMPKLNPVTVAKLGQEEVAWWRFALCVLIGILMAFVFERLTDYYVSLEGRPVRETAMVSSAGPAPMIIQGFSSGLESSVFSVVAIVISLLAPLFIFPPSQFGGAILSFFGIALVGLGLLTTTGYILAMDTFGPISDNAQGVFEMSGAGHSNPEAARAVQRLDAAGNTTKALTKGFAIATAVVAAVALFHSYVEAAMLTTTGMRVEVPHIFLGLLIGGAAPYLFSAFSINAVGRAAFDLINDVRRQFRENPGIMAGTEKPDYAACVSIVTAAAQKELLGPGVLAIFLPVAVAFGFGIGQPTTIVDGVTVNLSGAQALGGFLAGTILSGQLMAVTLANSGGLWDNSKKLIEDGLHGGKGTEAHKAGVVCDTVGDPFKDTAGPALNPLIKVMNLVALLLAPVIIVPMKPAVQVGITLFAVAMLAFSYIWSKRGSVSDRLQEAQNV